MNSDDLRLAHIIKEGSNGDVVIVGAPFDYLRRKVIKKGGEQNGPCCLRRFFTRVGPIVNAQYGVSIESLNVSDYGNILIDQKDDKNGLEKCLAKITDEIYYIIHNNKLPFVFGGSKQALLGVSESFYKQYPKGKHVVIAGKPSFKKNEGIATSDNSLTILCQKYPETIILFGPHSKYFPPNSKINFQYISYETIRDTNMEDQSQEKIVNTQGAKAFLSTLENIGQDLRIQVSLSVEAIQKFRGCRDLINFGLSVEQIIEIFWILGQDQRIVSIDINQFNPSCEDYESSILLVNLLYYFLMGFTKRNKK